MVKKKLIDIIIFSLQVKEHNQSLMELEQTISDLQLENQQLRQKRQTPKLAINFSGVSGEEVKDGVTDIQQTKEPDSKTIRNVTVTTQTYETAFLECMTCEALQSLLLSIGKAVVEMCEKRSVPSSTNKHNKILRTTKLSHGIASKWTVEVEKDLQRIELLINEIETGLQGENKINEELELKINNLEGIIKELKLNKSQFDSVESELKIRCKFHEDQYTKLNLHTKDVEAKLIEKTMDLKHSQQQIEELEKKLELSAGEVKNLKISVQLLGIMFIINLFYFDFFHTF